MSESESGDSDDQSVPSAISTDSSAYTSGVESGASLYGSDHYRKWTKTDDSQEPADDVDPRRLHGEPTPDEIRWYCRNTPFAPTIKNKPVDDAFKHGYEVLEDNTKQATELLERWEPHRQRARKAAREDGFAFVHIVYQDEEPASRSPENVRGVTDFNVLTLEQLATNFEQPNHRHNRRSGAVHPREIAKHVKYDEEQIRVLPQGVAIVEDISSPDHHDIVGAIYQLSQYEPDEELSESQYRFIHADRLQHFVHNPDVSGPIDERWVGKVTGHPVIAPVYPQLKNLSKTTWALGQAVYRYSAPLLVTEIETGVQPQDGDWDSHMEAINAQMADVNTDSSATMPPGHEVKAISSDSEMDAASKVETLVEMLCAGTEFTKSVLMGTMPGTTTGSETDIKNYFNQVQRYRQTTGTEKMYELLGMVSTAAPDDVYSNLVNGVDFEWGPLFKIDELDTTEAMVRVVTAASNAVNSYLMTPEDAQSLIEEQWATLGVDVELSELDEDAFDQLDRVNVSRNEMTKGTEEAEVDPEGNPRVGQNGGGMEQGQTTSASNPTSDIAAFLLDADYDSGDPVATPNGVGVVSGEVSESIENLPGGGSVDGTDKDVYVVGFGGAFGLYTPDVLQAVDSVEANERTDGEALHYHDGPENVDTSSLPEGWDETSLLSWWASIGGEWSEAKKALAEQRDISESTAENVAARYKQMVLGTDEQITR